MIFLIVGKPRSGKTQFAVKKIFDQIELNKKYHVKQLSKIEQLFLIEKEEKNPKIIIDISKLKNEDKRELEKLSTANLILFYEDHINEDLENKALKVYQKPLSHDILNSL